MKQFLNNLLLWTNISEVVNPKPQGPHAKVDLYDNGEGGRAADGCSLHSHVIWCEGLKGP